MGEKPTYQELEKRVKELEADTTRQKLAAQTLRGSEISYREVFENSMEAIFLTSHDGTVLKANIAACRMLDRTEEEILKLGREGVIDPSDPRIKTVLEERDRTGKFAGELNFVRRGGESFPVDVVSTVFTDKDGNQRAAILARDITERKRMEDSLRESERRFRGYFDLGIIGMAVVTADKGFEQFNDRICEILGYSRQELATKNWAELTHPEDLADDLAQFNRVLSGEIDGYCMEKRFIKKDGNIVYARISGKCIRKENGEIDHFVAMLDDITERVAAEEALRVSEERFKELAETLPQGVYEVDTEGVLTYANQRAAEMFGYPREDVEKGLRVLDMLAPEERERASREIDSVLKGSATGKGNEYRAPHKDGGYIFVDIYSTPIVRRGKTVGMRGVIVDVTERVKTEAELAAQKSFFEQMFLQSPINTQILDKEGWCLRINRKFSEFFGVAPEDMEGHRYNVFADEGVRQAGVVPYLEEVFKEGKTFELDVHFDVGLAASSQDIRIFEEKKVWLRSKSFPIFDVNGHIKYVIVQHEDISAQKRAEQEKDEMQAKLNQVQKMESVGRLAGGVAHDLNNLLSPILGYGEMLQMDIDPHDGRREAVDQIIKAAVRARDVIRQLLTFSRKQAMVVTLADLNQVIKGFEKLLRRTIREDIEIRVLLAEGLPLARVDTGQMEQVIMNLAVNAQDAMPQGGALTMRTESCVLDEGFCANHPGSRPGAYAMLSVSDTGAGMDDETAKHVFEPFFTTKGEHGTGLGLASVYGIVKQHDGYISVESGAGQGTTFRVYVPATEGQPQANEAEGAKTDVLQGSETVLIAEDNDQIRLLGQSLLGRLGYKVLVAENGKDALEVLRSREGRIDLLLTDVVMPDMNGRYLFEMAHEKYPSLKVLYMSGYSGTVLANRGVLEEGVEIIQKPFSVWGLAAKVREVLDKA